MPGPLQNGAVNVYAHSLSLLHRNAAVLKNSPLFSFQFFFGVPPAPSTIHLAYRATAGSVLVAAVIGQRQQNDSFKPAHYERASNVVKGSHG